jgi:hypothetical protein
LIWVNINRFKIIDWFTCYAGVEFSTTSTA